MGPLGKIASMYVLVLAFKKLLDQLLARLCIYTLLISREDELTCRSLAVQNGLPQDTEKTPKQNRKRWLLHWGESVFSNVVPCNPVEVFLLGGSWPCQKARLCLGDCGRIWALTPHCLSCWHQIQRTRDVFHVVLWEVLPYQRAVRLAACVFTWDVTAALK